MHRLLTIAAAQLGPIARDDCRSWSVVRSVGLMCDAKSRGADLVVLPELALTTFFPRWLFEQQAEVDAFFETAMPSPTTRPLCKAAAELGVGLSRLGRATP